MNVVLVSGFVSFTRFRHPPAIALTIFSYIVHETISFFLASLLVLSTIAIFQRISKRYG
jgi:hypothetical protein